MLFLAKGQFLNIRYFKMKKDLSSRQDVSTLVHRFYTKVRENDDIGFFFNDKIKNWDEHLEKLTDFWTSNLFFKRLYKGNPKAAHIEVDEHFDHQIEQAHFGIWLNLWYETIDELFEGEYAQRAKNNARKMATHLYLKIYEAR